MSSFFIRRRFQGVPQICRSSPRFGKAAYSPKAFFRSRNRLTASSKEPVPATQLSRSAFFADFYAYPGASAAFVVFAFASNPHR